MSVKAFFQKAAAPVVRFLENQEIAALKGNKEWAESGFRYVAARGGAVLVKATPEEARSVIESCDRRLAVLEERRAARNLQP